MVLITVSSPFDKHIQGSHLGVLMLPRNPALSIASPFLVTHFKAEKEQWHPAYKLKDPGT